MVWDALGDKKLLLTPKDVAKVLSIPTQSLYNQKCSGELPFPIFSRSGKARSWYVKIDDLLNHLNLENKPYSQEIPEEWRSKKPSKKNCTFIGYQGKVLPVGNEAAIAAFFAAASKSQEIQENALVAANQFIELFEGYEPKPSKPRLDPNFVIRLSDKIKTMHKFSMISEKAISRRAYWVNEITNLAGNFSNYTSKLIDELRAEIAKDGTEALLDHLRLCADIPESYRHDSSEEKLYSKYTDALLCETFRKLGLTSEIFTERADAADVEAWTPKEGYSLVADAKAFRLSRTAKNQKDFKVQAMDGWRRTKDYAIVVAPLYQLPEKSSQIYQQAITRNVCILSYSHLAVLTRISTEASEKDAQMMLEKVLKVVNTLPTTKDAAAYWTSINSTMLNHKCGVNVAQIWREEKISTEEGLHVAKEFALNFVSQERDRIAKMTHEEAISALLKLEKIESRIVTIKGVTNSKIMNLS